MDATIAQAKDKPSGEERQTARLEAFSDGVFAVAITLLVLDIKVPSLDNLPKGLTLGGALLEEWPAYMAYFTSFLTILIYWVNHHNLFKHIKMVDHTFLLLNGLLLMTITVIPFPTSLLVAYIRQPEEQQIVALVYSGTSVVLALIFFFFWSYAAANNRLLSDGADQKEMRNLTNQYRLGPLVNSVAFVLAFVNAWLSFSVCLLLALFFAFPRSIIPTAKREAAEDE